MLFFRSLFFRSFAFISIETEQSISKIITSENHMSKQYWSTTTQRKCFRENAFVAARARVNTFKARFRQKQAKEFCQ